CRQLVQSVIKAKSRHCVGILVYHTITIVLLIELSPVVFNRCSLFKSLEGLILRLLFALHVTHFSSFFYISSFYGCCSQVINSYYIYTLCTCNRLIYYFVHIFLIKGGSDNLRFKT